MILIPTANTHCQLLCYHIFLCVHPIVMLFSCVANYALMIFQLSTMNKRAEGELLHYLMIHT